MNIWPFRKRSTTVRDSGLFNGFCDWHSHILPGVDDGVKTMEESLEILRLYEQLGVDTVWLTPHIMEDIPNNSEKLCGVLDELELAYGGPIKLNLAAEYMLDSLFDERLGIDNILTTGFDGNSVLVETSRVNPPMAFEEMLSEIKSKGYYPILAHPERYRYMEMSDYRKLKKQGVKFQLNLPSLAGFYSPQTTQKAEKLLDAGFYEYVGCDVHRISMVEKMLEIKISDKILKKIINIIKSNQ